MPQDGNADLTMARHRVCCKATFYNWKKKFGSLGVSKLRRLRQLEEENQQLKKLVADLSLDKQMLQDVSESGLIHQKSSKANSKGWPIV
jgi:putative transposase